jgi:two-component system, NtrC family, response regulator HydG
MGSARVLAVDDERSTCQAIAEMLGQWGYRVETAGNGNEAVKKALEFHPDVVVSDLAMPETDGLWLLRQLHNDLPDCPVLFLTGRATIGAAVEAIREGAYDFIEKPVDPSRLKVSLSRALERGETQREVLGLKRRLKQLGDTEFIGRSPAMARVIDLIHKVGPAKAAVMITGESGTGKEMVARSVHGLSPRSGRPFVAINCASIPASLIESELFGHERGAFTGADQRRLGVFELASGGTLFLDEVGEIPPELQPKLLRVLEEGRLRRLGGKGETEVDVRVLCATNRDLRAAIKGGVFREDLFFRLNVFQIQLPALRERREDVPMLAQHFVHKFGAEAAKRLVGIRPNAIQVLKRHDWPGNIRELRNAIERAVILCDGEWIDVNHLPPEITGRSPERAAIRLAAGLTLDTVEKEYILYSLERNGGNKARTADVLGVSEKTLYNKLNRYTAEAVQGAQGPPGPPSDSPVRPPLPDDLRAR